MRFVPVLFFLVVLFNSCSINNFSIDNDLKQYFDKYKATGSFALFDNAQAEFTIYHLRFTIHYLRFILSQ